jgi:hypothetical protein
VNKCYAEPLGDCGGKLSREHFISGTLLRDRNAVFSVEGLDPSRPEVVREVSAAALTARVLCEHHNSRLSDVDSASAPFLRHCRRFDHDLGDDSSARFDEFVGSGAMVERWMAKALLGLLGRRGASGLPTSAHQELLLGIAFGASPQPPHGLYLDASPGRIMFSDPDYSLIALTRPTGECGGVIFAAGSIRWFFPLGKPDLLPIEAYRPSAVVLRSRGKERILRLEWPASHETANGTIWLERTPISPAAHPSLFVPTRQQGFGSIRPGDSPV